MQVFAAVRLKLQGSERAGRLVEGAGFAAKRVKKFAVAVDNVAGLQLDEGVEMKKQETQTMRSERRVYRDKKKKKKLQQRGFEGQGEQVTGRD